MAVLDHPGFAAVRLHGGGAPYPLLRRPCSCGWCTVSADMVAHSVREASLSEDNAAAGIGLRPPRASLSGHG